MGWNWQNKEWPKFRYEREALSGFEAEFLKQGGVLIGAFKHFHTEDRNAVTAELLCEAAIRTSAIEGEVLDRESVRSSIFRLLGLQADGARERPVERGISEMMIDVHNDVLTGLDHETLFRWHKKLFHERTDVRCIGGYRTNPEPMRIVSGALHNPRIHFEAPPSTNVKQEMSRFLKWFNKSTPDGEHPLPPVTRAGIAHIYFESIHPFEDGNGRIGRAVSEKALAEGLGHPSLTMLSYEIHLRQKKYYEMLEGASKDIEISDWLVWFAEVVIAAQKHALNWIDFIIRKTKLLDKLRGAINERQEKGLLRMMKEGPRGFEGGLSASNYQRITGASPATARRDLSELVKLGALRRAGERKSTRYWLVLD
jgi:Fic family protein